VTKSVRFPLTILSSQHLGLSVACMLKRRLHSVSNFERVIRRLKTTILVGRSVSMPNDMYRRPTVPGVIFVFEMSIASVNGVC
jgi:hypothetical protein